MKLLKLARVAFLAGTAALVGSVVGTGLANAIELPSPEGLERLMESNAISGLGGVHYRTMADYSPDRSGRLKLQPLGTYGSADAREGCDAWVV